MDVGATLSGLRQWAALPAGGRSHVARGFARAVAIRAHNIAALRFVLPQGAFRTSPDEEAEVRRRLFALYAADYRNVKDGVYPESLADGFSWWDLLKSYPRLIRDAPLMRRHAFAKVYDDLPDDAAGYPKYYRRNFHFQTDGYLGSDSAAIYESQVELLFAGSAGAMHRQVLPPLVRELRERPKPRILDLACGTGPVLRMLHTALPHAQLFGVDLSPHYIARARERLGDVMPLSLVVENAETLPFVDGYFDAVTNVYLMHELPPDVRDRVLREVARVLVPGGLFVLADSVQIADAPAIARQLDSFPVRFHEPFYRQYSRDDMAARLRRAGLEPIDTQQHFLTKVTVCRQRAA